MKFVDDNAIHKLEDDVLGRRPFAEKLGNVISEWDRTESIVIALYGPWGSGKTSILDMAVDQIKRNDRAEAKGPIVLKFNPWHFSDQSELLRMFFIQLYGQIRKYRPDIGLEMETRFSKLAKALGALEAAPKIGGFVSISKVALGIATLETLEDHRDAVEKLFYKLDRRIIIVMDDVDRLTYSEIRHLFQTIKLNANFPNTVYVVAFDRQVVEKALESEQGAKGKGRAYIEKIVQVGFDVPMVEKSRVEEFLDQALRAIITPIPDNSWNNDRWIDLYHSGFKYLFSSLRDVKRFVNSLSFTFNLIPAEINPVDFIGLEALRVFLPDIYYGISRSKDIFTSITWFGQHETEKKARSDTIDKIFQEEMDEEKRKIAKSICLKLFPPIQSYFGGTVYAPDYQKNWRQERRVCSAEVFDTYFILGLPRGEISQEEMIAIMKSASDKSVFSANINALVTQDRIMRFLNLAQDEIENLENGSVRGFIETLVELGDRLPYQDEEFSILGSDFRIARLIYLSLMKLDAETRCRQMAEMVKGTNSLYQILFTIALDSRSAEGTRRDNPLFSEDCLTKLQESCVSKIEQWAQDGRLINSPNLSFVLFRWRDWGKTKVALTNFINNAISTQKGLVNLVMGFVTPVQVFSSNQPNIEWQVNMKNVAELMDPEQIWGKLKELSDNIRQNLGDVEKRAIEAFTNSYLHWLKINKKDSFPYGSLAD